jgi:transcriptional regulator with XRE-family HTH domain
MTNGYLNEQAVGLLRTLMGTRGVTQAELARRLSVTPASVNRALSGRQNLTLATIQSYMEALEYRGFVGVDPAESGVSS